MPWADFQLRNNADIGMNFEYTQAAVAINSADRASARFGISRVQARLSAAQQRVIDSPQSQAGYAGTGAIFVRRPWPYSWRAVRYARNPRPCPVALAYSRNASAACLVAMLPRCHAMHAERGWPHRRCPLTSHSHAIAGS